MACYVRFFKCVRRLRRAIMSESEPFSCSGSEYVPEQSESDFEDHPSAKITRIKYVHEAKLINKKKKYTDFFDVATGDSKTMKIAKCKLCKNKEQRYKMPNSGTSSLKRHLIKSHKKLYEEEFPQEATTSGTSSVCDSNNIKRWIQNCNNDLVSFYTNK